MSYNTNSKVNPFYIQDDEEDPWDDDYGDGEYDKEDYDGEQVMLISGSGNNNNRKYNDALPNIMHHRHSVFGHSNFFRSYHDGQYEMRGSHNRHRPHLFKYGVLLFTIAAVVFGLSSSSNEFENEGNGNKKNYASLIDKIPNDDYRIVVLGERHSGTVWMSDRLRECFPNAEISTDLQRKGYLFQDDEATALSKEEVLGNNHHTIPKNNVDTIVVHVTLNIYDWLEQMRLSPEYAPDHVGKHHELGHDVPLGWEEFLSKPWTTERPPTDLLLANETGPVCQMGFHYNEIVSCAEPTSGIGDPLYELQPDGRPFESIIDLRTAKLKNHHGIMESWSSVGKMIQVPYETLAQHFKHKLQEILAFTKWNGGFYEHEGVSLPCSGNVLPPSLDSSNEMTLDFVEYVTKHADWKTEEDVATYVRWTENDISDKGIRPATTVSMSPKAADIDEGSSVDDDGKNKQAPNDDSIKTKEAKETTSGLDQSSPPPSNKLSVEEIPEADTEIEANETKGKDDGVESSTSSGSSQNAEDDSKKECDDGTNDNSTSKQITKEDNSANGSSNDEKTKEENEDLDPPLPSTKEEPNDENHTEPPQITQEEPPAGGNENSKEDEILEGKDKLSKDAAVSTNNSSDEKEEEQPSSTKSSPDEKEENRPSTTTLSGKSGNDDPSKEAGEFSVAIISEEFSDNDTKSNEKDVMAEKYAGNSDHEGSLPSESTSDSNEVVTQTEKEKKSEGNDVIADDENKNGKSGKNGTEAEVSVSVEKQKDSEGKDTVVDNEIKNDTEAVVSASKSEETVQEGKSNTKKETPSDNNTESNEEVLTIEKNAGKTDLGEASPTESTIEKNAGNTDLEEASPTESTMEKNAGNTDFEEASPTESTIEKKAGNTDFEEASPTESAMEKNAGNTDFEETSPTESTSEKKAGNTDLEEASSSESTSDGDEAKTKDDNDKVTETETETQKGSEGNARSTGD